MSLHYDDLISESNSFISSCVLTFKGTVNVYSVHFESGCRGFAFSPVKLKRYIYFVINSIIKILGNFLKSVS